MMKRVDAPMEGLLDLWVDSELQQYVRLQSKVYVMLGKIEGGVYNQTLLNLGRGWCSALSGRAFKIYCMLAGHYGFPVFALGRSNQMIVSCRLSSDESTDEFIKKYEALWNLGKNPNDTAWRRRYFNTYTKRGPAEGWSMVQMNRAPNVSLQGLLHTGGWNSIWDVVPKTNALEALSAVQRKEIIEVEINS